MSVKDKIETLNASQKLLEQLRSRGCPEIMAEKSGCLFVEPVEPGTVVETYTDKGLETTNTAKEGQVLVHAATPDGQYITVQGDKKNSWLMDEETLNKKYNTAEITDDGFVKPNGGPQRFIQVDEDVVIHASWGEDQNIPAGGYLNITDENKIYGIEKDLFDKTYKVIGDAPMPEREVKAHNEVGLDEF